MQCRKKFPETVGFDYASIRHRELNSLPKKYMKTAARERTAVFCAQKFIKLMLAVSYYLLKINKKVEKICNRVFEHFEVIISFRF